MNPHVTNIFQPMIWLFCGSLLWVRQRNLVKNHMTPRNTPRKPKGMRRNSTEINQSGIAGMISTSTTIPTPIDLLRNFLFSNRASNIKRGAVSKIKAREPNGVNREGTGLNSNCVHIRRSKAGQRPALRQ